MTKTLLEIWVQLRTKYQEPGTKYLVPSIWYQVFGTNIGTNILENRGGARSAPPEDSSIYIYIYQSCTGLPTRFGIWQLVFEILRLATGI